MTVPAPTVLGPEPIIAAMGLDKILARDPKFGEAERQAALTIPRKIRAEINRFLSSTTLDDAAPLPEFDYETVAKLLEDDNPEQEAKVFALFPGDLGLEVNNEANRISRTLEAKFPRVVRKSSVKAEVDPPSDTELADFARGWFVACDPMIVLRDLNEGSISADEVEALAEFYPETYKLIQTLVGDCTDSMRARRPGWDLTRDRDDILRTLTGEESERPSLFTDFEAVFAQGQQEDAQKAQAAPGGHGKASEAPTLQTPGQAP